ncbi:MAG: hypothetical protein JSS72_03655 [Armatimonadetes bacterium]|nr:hypothetical protein [Armatimonadota bacterium]
MPIILSLLIALQSTTPATITGHASAIIGSKVFVTGGMSINNEGHFYKEAWLVEPETGMWEALPPMKIARGMAAAALLDNAVYVAGGFTWGGDAQTTVDRFDLKTRAWSEVAPLNIPRSRLGLTALDGKLYAISGMNSVPNGRKSLNTPTIEEYDPARNRWQVVGSLNHARHGFESIVWHGRIYMFGGNDDETRKSAEVWDPKTGKSSDLPNLPCERGFAGIVQVGEKFVLFGGRTDGGTLSLFDPATSRWLACTTPDIQRTRFAATMIGSRLWLIGGEGRGKIPIIQSFDLSQISKN